MENSICFVVFIFESFPYTVFHLDRLIRYFIMALFLMPLCYIDFKYLSQYKYTLNAFVCNSDDLPSNPIFESVLKYVHPTHNYFTQIDSICYSGQLNICIVKRIANRQQQKKNMKSLKFILYTILSVSCLIHILLIGNQLLHPNLPDTRIYKKYLKEIEFPISFRICAYNLSSATRKYENVGYRYAYDFFSRVKMLLFHYMLMKETRKVLHFVCESI